MKNIDEHAVTAAGGRVLLDGDGVTKSGISIGGWTITSTEGHIATDAKAEQFKEELGILSIPEQWYASNSLDLEHEASGTQFSFQAEDALRAWRAHQLAAVHVAASEQWTHSRKSEMEAHHAKQLEYDWTFTTDYSGTVAGPNGKEEQHHSASWEATPDQMDRTLLTNRDPILFFEELLLYESELEDNGLSTLSVKIRVMPKCCSTGEITNLGAEPGDGGGGGSGGEKKHAAMVVLREVKFQEGTFEELKKAGAPPEGPVYADGDTAAVALAAVAPIGLTKYVMEKLSL
ncbi:hypothetical protein Ndes2526A_g05272 [Nannochloris sp. 'desiccata']